MNANPFIRLVLQPHHEEIERILDQKFTAVFSVYRDEPAENISERVSIDFQIRSLDHIENHEEVVKFIHALLHDPYVKDFMINYLKSDSPFPKRVRNFVTNTLMDKIRRGIKHAKAT